MSEVGLLSWTSGESGCESLSIDLQLYTLEAVFRTCYQFTDRCYLYITEDPKNASKIIVHLDPLHPGSGLRPIIGQFGNELIHQRLQSIVARETAEIREVIVRQAFAEADFKKEDR